MKKITISIGLIVFFIFILFTIYADDESETIFQLNFTTCGKTTGGTGPTQNECNVAYNNTLLQDVVNVTSGVQKWIMPYNGLCTIEAYGAIAGSSGNGSKISGDFNLKQQDEIYIIAGHRGQALRPSSKWVYTGGGGTFVLLKNQTSTTKLLNSINVSALVVAGGGGGNGGTGRGNTILGVVDTAGQAGSGETATSSAGTNGGNGGALNIGGAAYGFFSVLANPSVSGVFGGGGYSSGWHSTKSSSLGGGGYSGGGGGQGNSPRGGGGGSYNVGDNQNNIEAAHSSTGKVIITCEPPKDIIFTIPDKTGLVNCSNPEDICLNFTFQNLSMLQLYNITKHDIANYTMFVRNSANETIAKYENMLANYSINYIFNFSELNFSSAETTYNVVFVLTDFNNNTFNQTTFLETYGANFVLNISLISPSNDSTIYVSPETFIGNLNLTKIPSLESVKLKNATLWTDIDGWQAEESKNILINTTIFDNSSMTANIEFSASNVLLGTTYHQNLSQPETNPKIYYLNASMSKYSPSLSTFYVKFFYDDLTTNLSNTQSFGSAVSSGVVTFINPYSQKNVEKIEYYVSSSSSYSANSQSLYNFYFYQNQFIDNYQVSFIRDIPISSVFKWNIQSCTTDGDCFFGEHNYTASRNNWQVFINTISPPDDFSTPLNYVNLSFNISVSSDTNATFLDENNNTICSTIINVQNNSVHSCLWDNLNYSTTYNWKIRFTNGFSIVDNEHFFHTLTKPPQPINVSPILNAVDVSKNTVLNVSVDTSGYSTIMYFLNSTDGIIDTFENIENNTFYASNWLNNWNTFQTWKIRLNYSNTFVDYIYNFTTKNQPLLTNYRIDEINENNVTVAWTSDEDISWVSYTLYRNGITVDATGVTTNANITIIGLLENTDYVLVWQTSDTSPAESDYFNMSFRTKGWNPELQSWLYRRLITVNHSDIIEDTNFDILNITLTNDNFKTCLMYCEWPGFEVWGTSFGKLNYTDLSDIRFTNYYETNFLNFSINSSDIKGLGGVNYSTIPNENSFEGSWIDSENCHDDNWGTSGYADGFGINYFNYTIPEGALTSSVLRAYIGEYYWDSYIPYECFVDDKLQFKIESNSSTPSASIYCNDGTDWVYIYDNGDVSAYVYDTMITWYFSNSVTFLVQTERFNDSYQNHTRGIDSDYDIKFWMYYGASNVNSTNQSNLDYSSISAPSFSVGDEETFQEDPPVISNISEYDNTSNSIKISWNVDKNSNHKIQYSTNEWFFDFEETNWQNQTLAPNFNLTSLTTNTKYYYRLISESFVSGLQTTSESSFILGTLPSTPEGIFKNYTENRLTKVSTVCFDVTNMNGNANLQVSIQYWNENSTTFNETSSSTLYSTGTICKNIDVEFGQHNVYRLKMVGATTGYSEIYENYFMPVQEFFAGSYITNHQDSNHVRQRRYCDSETCYEQTGYREGAKQEEDWIWIETSIVDKGSLNVNWFDGTSWMSYPMSYSDNGFYYKKLENLGNAYQTFYISNSTNTILNWTKPDLVHKNNESATYTSIYVSFNNTREELNYIITYLDYELFVGTSFDKCIENGGNIFDCMSVMTYGYPWLPENLVGTAYDRGRLFRGGVANGGPVDVGILQDNPSIRNIYETEIDLHDWAYMTHSGRMCFAFSAYYWNLEKIPSNNITNYYYRYWTQDDWRSTYYGYTQERRFDYSCMRYYYDDTGDWGEYGEENCLEGTLLTSENEIQHIDKSYFNSSYDQTLVSGFKDGFNIDTSGYKIYDLVMYFDARWTNQMINKHQQAFVIFNLPSNETLQSLDSDNDTINDFDELFVYYTNPYHADTDNDGYTDGYEISEGSDPNLYLYQYLLSIPKPHINITLSNDSVIQNEIINITFTKIEPTNDDIKNISNKIINSSGYILYENNQTDFTYSFNSSKVDNYTVFFSMRNFANQENNMTVYFSVLDLTPPYIEIISPINQTYNTTNILINISVSDDFDTIWFFNGTSNQTYTSPINITFSEGNHVLQSWVNDSFNNINHTSVSFRVELPESSSINLLLNISPTSSYQGMSNVSISWNYTIIEDDINTTSLSIRNPNNVIIYQTNESSGNLILIPANISVIGTYQVSFTATSLLGLSESKVSTFSINSLTSVIPGGGGSSTIIPLDDIIKEVTDKLTGIIDSKNKYLLITILIIFVLSIILIVVLVIIREKIVKK